MGSNLAEGHGRLSLLSVVCCQVEVSETGRSLVQRDRIECDTSLYENIYKDKAVPLQTWSGPEGSRKLRFPDFMTTAQDGGKVVSLTHRTPLPPGNTPGTHFC